MKQILPAICFLLLIAGCTTTPKDLPIKDVRNLSQDAGAYHDLPNQTPLLSPDTQQAAFIHFLGEHFDPWNRTTPKHTAEDVFWGFKSFTATMYGENTLPRDPAWMKQMHALSRVDHYPSMDKRAIAVTNTSMRVLPTNQPLFYDFAKAGEGYPFDYMQNSLVLAGTPLYASHYSADRAWIMVESRFTYGWVQAKDIAWVNDEFANAFQTGEYGAITHDDLPITDLNGTFRFTGHVGTILPVMKGKERDAGLTFIIPARTHDGQAIPRTAFVTSHSALLAPIAATPTNFSRLANAMLGRQYGWGGLYEDRDCSASIMDLMAGFGIYLPRNSSQQIKVGAYASLESLSREQKKQFLIAHATPFLTTIRKPGHIMLYVGQQDGQPIVFHSTWGLKTKKNGKYGRKIIGSTVITSLEPGQELPNLVRPEGILLETVNGMSTLPGIGEK